MPYRSSERSHPDEGLIASFIDGSCSEQESAEIAAHLRSCTSCAESYREAVLYKGLSISGAADFETTEESTGLAEKILGENGDSKGRSIDKVKKPARLFLSSSPFVRTIAVAACVVVIVAIGAVYHLANRTGPSLNEDYITAVQTALERASMSGNIVIPGGARLIGTVPETYRSGYARIDDSLRTALAYFSDEFQEDRTSREAVYWLLGGYIATGQVEAARNLASLAVREFPADTDIMIFDAIVSSMEGDNAASERKYRLVLEKSSDNPYANLNLAILLYERGDASGAEDLLQRVTEEHDGTPFEARAARIRKDILP